MQNDFVYEEMIELQADGVDFVPIWLGDMRHIPVISSFSKEEWLKETSYLKTNRLYWKIDEHGNKVYL